MGKFTYVYQDTKANLDLGAVCSYEDVNRYPLVGSGIGSSANTFVSSGTMELSYLSETFSTSDSDAYSHFQFSVAVSSSLGSPTGIWQVDVSYPEAGESWVLWDQGSFNITSGTNTNLKVNSNVLMAMSPARIPPEYNTYTQFRISLKTGFCTGTMFLTGVRLYNSNNQIFCPKDNQCHVLASSTVPNITNVFKNTSVGTLGNGALEDLSTALSGTITMLAGIEPGLTCYMDCRRPVKIDKIVLMAHAKDNIEIAIAGSNDGLLFYNNTILTTVTTRNQFVKYEEVLTIPSYRYYRVYVVDKDTGQPARQIAISDLRFYRDRDGFGEYQEVYYSRYALPKIRSR